MKYELLLQPSVTGQPFDPDAVEAELIKRGGSKRPDGAVVWRLTRGEVEVYRVLEAGRVGALAIKTPFGEKLDLIEEVLGALSEVAVALSLKLVDPQLSREVSYKDAGSVCEQFLLNARYAGEYVGVSEAVTVSFSKAGSEGMSLGTRVLLLVVAFVVFLLLAFRGFS